MTPRRLVAIATLSSVEHQQRRDDCPTGPLTRYDLTTIPRNVTDDVSWRQAAAYGLRVFAVTCFVLAVATGLAFWIVPTWLAL